MCIDVYMVIYRVPSMYSYTQHVYTYIYMCIYIYTVWEGTRWAKTFASRLRSSRACNKRITTILCRSLLCLCWFLLCPCRSLCVCAGRACSTRSRTMCVYIYIFMRVCTLCYIYIYIYMYL